MANQQLLDYIRQSLAGGASKEDVRSALLNVGWPQEEVDDALGNISLGAPALPFQVNLEQEVKKGKKWLIVKILVLIFIIILASSASAAYYYLVQRPKSVLQQLPNRISDIKTFEYQISGNSKMTFVSGEFKDVYGALGKPVDSTINVNGSIDLSDADKTKGTVKFLYNGKNPNLFDLRLGVELVFVPQIFYLKLSDFNVLSHEKNEEIDMEMINFFSAPLKDKWIKFDIKSVKQQSPVNIEIPSTDTATIKEDYQKILGKYEKYSSQDLISVESVKSEELNGKKVYHYKIALNSDSVGWFIQAVQEVSSNKDYDQMSQAEKDELSQSVNDIQTSLSGIESIDLYVGKNDFYPYRLKISGGVNNYKIDNQNVVDAEGSFEINLSNINQSVIVDEPNNFRTFEEIMAGIMGQLFGGAEEGGLIK